MEKIVGDWSTEVRMDKEEAESVCKLNKGSECCAFLVMDREGFSCIRMDYPTNASIFTRLEEGTMNAKGEGGWEGCVWAGKI